MSPISGVVARVGVRAGDRVDGASAVVDVLDPGRLELVAAVPAWQLRRLRSGLAGRVRSDGVSWGGEVTFVGEVVSPDTGLGVVRVAVDGDGATAGALASAEITLADPEPVLTAPVSAFAQADDGTWSAEVCGDAAPRAVSLGADRPDGRVVVLTGLAAGEQVRIAPARVAE